MTVAETIKERVYENLAVEHYDLLNESHQHAGPATESHFKLTVVTDDFAGLMRVKRHQKMFAMFQDLLDGPVHALSMHLFTTEEWQARQQQVADSPNCRGVGQ